jgi:methyl-accepting chemotaxis protein
MKTTSHANLVAVASFACVVMSGALSLAVGQPAVGFVLAALSVPASLLSVRLWMPPPEIQAAPTSSIDIQRTAARGEIAVRKTLDGVAGMRASALHARSAIVDQLHKVDLVRQTVLVIRDAAEQTHVAAVHAAAATAGGPSAQSLRAAERVQELAARVTTATIDITDHIDNIVRTSKTAMRGIQQCERHLDVMADLSGIATRALSDITQAAETADPTPTPVQRLSS